MILSCAMPVCRSCNSSFGWVARECTRSLGLLTGQESCLSPEQQLRYSSDLSPWELEFASSHAQPRLNCRLPCVDYVETSAILESSKSNFSGSMGLGWQLISIRACLTRSGWTSAGVCRFRFLACLDFLGEFETLREAVSSAQTEQFEQTVFFDRFTLRAILLARSMTARISRDDNLYWHGWIKRNTAHAVDFSADAADPKPGLIHALSEIYLGLKSLPRFLRLTPRASTQAPHLLSKEPL